MPMKTLRKNGREYVVVPRDDYDRLVLRAKAANLPPLPKPDADGNYPALEYVRATIARDIVRDRIAAGLTQRELARRAGIRVETLCRIETGKHTASVPTIDRIDRALRQAGGKRKTK
jgi:DNA-binding XRE family transcriptional regulator